MTGGTFLVGYPCTLYSIQRSKTFLALYSFKSYRARNEPRSRNSASWPKVKEGKITFCLVFWQCPVLGPFYIAWQTWQYFSFPSVLEVTSAPPLPAPRAGTLLILCKYPGCSHRDKSYLHANFKQNAKTTFKGSCDLCLAFDCKGPVTSLSWGQISYTQSLNNIGQ